MGYRQLRIFSNLSVKSNKKSCVSHLKNTMRPEIPWQDGQATNTSDGEDTWKVSKQAQTKRKRNRASLVIILDCLIRLSRSVWLFLILLGLLTSSVSCWNIKHTSHCFSRRVFFKQTVTACVISQTIAQPAAARNLPEVARIDPSRTGTVDTLIPILTLQYSIDQLIRACQQGSIGKLASKDVRRIVESVPTTEMDFKAIFDAYSDPVSYKQRFVDQNAFLVYYTKGFDGPGRPSIESDLPEKQTLQFGARNDAWVAWEDFLAEYEYSSQHPEDASFEDLQKALARSMDAINRYLSLAPRADVEAARLVASQQ